MERFDFLSAAQQRGDDRAEAGVEPGDIQRHGAASAGLVRRGDQAAEDLVAQVQQPLSALGPLLIGERGAGQERLPGGERRRGAGAAGCGAGCLAAGRAGGFAGGGAGSSSWARATKRSNRQSTGG